MRAFVFLLVLANLVFFAWAQGYFGREEGPDAVRLGQQIAPERLKVLSSGRAPASSPEAAAPAESPGAGNGPPEAALAQAARPDAAPAERCLSWSGLSSTEADRLDALLEETRFAGLRRVRHGTAAGKSSWWVFIPPQASRAAAEKKAGELRQLGISEYFIVQDPPAQRHALSLGIFSTEQAAEAHLAALQAKGVRSARAAPRATGRETGIVLEVSGSDPSIGAFAETARQSFPKAAAGVCPP